MNIKKFFPAVIFALLVLPNIAMATSPDSPTINPVNQESLLITGLTPKNTDVVVYVDDEFIGVANTTNEGTESDNFSFSASGLLKAGEHKVSVAAKDKQTLSLSAFSTKESFIVTEERSFKPEISKIAVNEELVSANQTIEGLTGSEAESFNLEELDTQENSNINEGEDKNKNLLRWNLAIFIFFLIAVIVWIIWVNRELKKEKELEEQKSDSE